MHRDWSVSKFMKFYGGGIYKKPGKKSFIKPFLFGILCGFILTVILMNII